VTAANQTLKPLEVFYLFHMSSSQYERELKNILEGEEKTLSKITKTCTALEKGSYYAICNKPFAVVRAAGSFGCDLVALRGDISFLMEIKTSIEDSIHFSRISGKLQEQATKMIQDCEKTKVLPIYAFRLKGYKGDQWRLFTMNVSGLDGRAKLLQNRLPKLSQTKDGNFIMRWKEGMPLSKFISYLCQ
jgi:Holliday junction resolvase